MQSLNDREWKEFFISGNDGVFTIHATKGGIDKNKLLDNGIKNIPYVTRSEMSNGLDMFVSENQDIKYQLNNGNCISVGLDTQTVFYQPFNFWTGQNIQIVNSKHITKYSGLFICSMLKVQLKKFNWGGNGATLGRLSRTKILLPINELENPDYEFMESYVKQLIQNKTNEYVTMYAKKILGELGEIKPIPLLSEKEWNDFFIMDIFTDVKRGKRLITKNQIKGDIPYVSSSALNNGIDNFISNKNNVRIYNNCLTLANSGSVGSCFYQPFTFVASDHVTHLKHDDFNKYVYLFISVVASRLSNKYNFNREINDKRISREKILLPITDEGNPDYDYMEQYIKNLMIKKYNSYLKYLKL